MFDILKGAESWNSMGKCCAVISEALVLSEKFLIYLLCNTITFKISNYLPTS